eukprot:gnl/MRDRNA2_/MRDRNA2_19427_c0_seq2.p1 gnl/MRDRNA2_/MRDRNA2_19427_c0~~gnl/MRDRNA2_/MRDRNA2_19427_c0_seq2.p1  ORF type:complete len:304 (-),score=58.08 gnl/MRDRNA2_/MRDRNA2_19427_c0_seq2:187-1098(-)
MQEMRAINGIVLTFVVQIHTTETKLRASQQPWTPEHASKWNWVNRDLQPVPGLSSKSLTSDSTSEESMEEIQEKELAGADAQPAKKKRKYKKWRLKLRLTALRPKSPHTPYTVYPGERKRRTFIHVHGLLDDEMIHRVRYCFRHPSVVPLDDRKQSLVYKHKAFRVELPLRSHAPVLYKRICRVMRWADSVVWKKMGKLKKEVVYPEIEYIVYDARNGMNGTIEPHIDNESAVSVVILLTDINEFEGGLNVFAPSEYKSNAKNRSLQLQKGDAVLFRGEKLSHWITPVTSGIRVILQAEFSKK